MQSEAAYTLKDNNLDHGSTSEFITASKCDLCLKGDFSGCTEEHGRMHQPQPGGRGSLVHFPRSNDITIIQRLVQEPFLKKELQLGCFLL